MLHSRPVSTIRLANQDLKWAVRSPLLCFSPPPHYEEWSKASPLTPIEREEIGLYRHPPIGRYFERLVTHWLGNLDSVIGLEANLTVFEGKRTVGELDLLFEAGGEFYQWELALKFYLGTSDRSDAKNWFGPLGRDRLDLKLNKLEGHQLRLLQSEAGQALLAERSISDVSSYAIMKGYLFHPFAQWLRGDFTAPQKVNANHGKGFWLHLCDIHQLTSIADNWVLLTKAEWLAPAERSDSMSTEEFATHLHHYFSTESRPPMVTALDDRGQERARGFIVPDSWEPSPVKNAG